MKNLSEVIETFCDWGKPWTFFEFIINNSQLSEEDKNQFLKIYEEASEFELWNFSDLAEGARNGTLFLQENTELSEKAIRQVVNSIAYEWR